MNAPKSRGWRVVRRMILTLACLATVIALFYAEEDWRGKRAWERCRRALEAKGVVLDWSAYIPPPVPDESNFFKAPGINEDDWVGRGSSALQKTIGKARDEEHRETNAVLVAEVTVVPTGSEGAWRVSDVHGKERGRQLIEDVFGGTLPRTSGGSFCTKPSNQIEVAHISLESARPESVEEVAALFPKSIHPNYVGGENALVRVEASESKAFRVLIAPAPQYAGDLLERTDSLEPIFENVREALKRPFARMDGDYSQPYAIPIPRFVTLVMVAQILADRAKCHLLMHQPNEALNDLMLVGDLGQITEAKPTGHPMTLVAAMINVAMTGHYADTAAEGLRRRVWAEPELARLQEQFEKIDLMPALGTSLTIERTSSFTTLEKTRPDDLFEAFRSVMGGSSSFWNRLHDPLYCFREFAPRGWVYQNLVVDFNLQPLAEIGDVREGVVSVEKANKASEEMTGDVFTMSSPYTFLVKWIVPNGSRAWQTLAVVQNKVNEGRIVCALERYRIVHGKYPEMLEALMPEFIAKLPHDIIGGGPLHYRRDGDGSFLLYSIGWNEKDDGGEAAMANGAPDVGNGDWVWPNHAQGE